MRNQIQITSFNILNSKYKFLFNILISLLIYLFINKDLFFSAYCTNENLPIMAEPKISNIKGTNIPTPLQIEVAGLLDYANIIQDQSKQIMEQNTQIQSLLNVQEELKEEQKTVENAYQEVLRQNHQNENHKRMLEFKLADKDRIIKNRENSIKLYEKSGECNRKALNDAINSCNANAKTIEEVVESSNAKNKTIRELIESCNANAKTIDELVKINNDNITSHARLFWFGVGFGIFTYAVCSYFSPQIELKDVSTTVKRMLELKK